MKEKECIFPGSFHPFTSGHRFLVEQALRLFDRVIVAVAEETYKEKMLPAKIRAEMAVKSLADLKGVDVECFSGMLTDFLRHKQCFTVVRGYRNAADYAYEKELERIYLSMDERVDFRLLPSDVPEITAETVRKKIAAGDEIDGLVSENIVNDIKKYYR